jgi:murein DD-endopeptidase MepM/ murein hydrolase activator NlpD
VFASASGTVTRSQCDRSGYGCYIVVDHGSSLRTLYGHCDQLYVKVGAVVKQGEAICKMGNTGRVFGPTGIHVHFEVIHNGVKRNPLLYF